MRDEIRRLRSQAVRARRLIEASTDIMAIASLKQLADECDARAETMEAALKPALHRP